jgi:hypothetical protein
LDADALEEAEAEVEAVRTAAALSAARRQLEESLREARTRASAEAHARESAEAKLEDAISRAEAAATAVRASTRARAASDAQLLSTVRALWVVKEDLISAHGQREQLQIALRSACNERASAVARAVRAEQECAAALTARGEAAQQLAAEKARSMALHADLDAALFSAVRPPTADAATEPIRELILAEQSAAAKMEVLMHEVRVLRLQCEHQQHRDYRWGAPRSRDCTDYAVDGGAMACREEERGGRDSLRQQESAGAAQLLAVTRAMVCWYRWARVRKTTRLHAATALQARVRGCLARRAIRTGVSTL